MGGTSLTVIGSTLAARMRATHDSLILGNVFRAILRPLLPDQLAATTKRRVRVGYVIADVTHLFYLARCSAAKLHYNHRRLPRASSRAKARQTARAPRGVPPSTPSKTTRRRAWTSWRTPLPLRSEGPPRRSRNCAGRGRRPRDPPRFQMVILRRRHAAARVRRTPGPDPTLRRNAGKNHIYMYISIFGVRLFISIWL